MLTLRIQVRRAAPLRPDDLDDLPWAASPAECGPWVASSGDHGARGRTPAEAIGELVMVLTGVDLPMVEVLVDGLFAEKVGGAA